MPSPSPPITSSGTVWVRGGMPCPSMLTEMKSSQMNDTSGTQKIAIDTWEVVPDEESQGPYF